MIKGKIHKEGRYIKPPDALTTKKQRYIKQKSEEIQGKRKKYIIIVRHTNIFIWEYFIKYRGNKNRSILTDVINNLNRIDFYLY